LASRIFRWSLLVLLIAVFGILTWYVWPQELIRPRFTISRETTYFTSPIDADGYVDYLAALNEYMQKGVTKENNAMVLLMQALGPKIEGGRLPPEFYQRLGIAEPEEKGAYFVNFRQFAKGKEWPENIDFYTINEWLGHATSRAWKSEEFPRVVEWIGINEKPMQVFEQASKRMRFLAPLSHPPDLELHQRLLFAAIIPWVGPIEDAIDLLIARAQWRIAEKQYDPAWQDFVTAIRLGRLVAQGPTLVESLGAARIETMAYRGIFSLLNSSDLQMDFLMRAQKEFDRLPTRPELAQRIQVGERCMALDALLAQHRYGPNATEAYMGKKFEPSDRRVLNSYRKLDWDPELKKINAWYDQMVAILKEKDRVKQQGEFQQMLMTTYSMRTKIDDERNSFWRFFDSTQTRLTRMADIMIVMLAPAIQRVQLTRDRMLQHERLVRVGLALAIYQKEKGTYPTSLAELAPKYIATIPDDLFTGKPMIYRKTDDGYLLYSVGPNGLDEEGRDEKSEQRGDDIVLRIPLPPLPKKED
jgi:hypothetical protein